MKAREVKRIMLEKYEDNIKTYIRVRVQLEAQHNRIRQLEFDLKEYFDIHKCYKFE